MGLIEKWLCKILDLNRDGKVDGAEKVLGLMMLHEMTKTKEVKKDLWSWREYCEDGSEYGIFPDEYETEEEYEEALEEARDECLYDEEDDFDLEDCEIDDDWDWK